MSQRVVIVGAGFGGIAAAIELRRHGIDDITILDKAPELGGTWFHNTYPGAACDVPSYLYSYSFAQRKDWSRLCSPQEEILEYVKGVARDHGIDRLVVGSCEVTSCVWDRGWTVSAASGQTYDADVLILATGQLHQPAYPRVEGLDDFKGHSFHSARWDHDYDLRGKRVAVIGTGASAVQFVPAIADQASRLTVFQRSGNWFMPRRNRPYPRPVKALMRSVPGVRAAWRSFWFYYTETLTQAIRHPEVLGRILSMRSWLFMRRQLRDPEVRRKAWPHYTFGCKRVLFSSDFLPALQRPGVELVAAPITRVTESGVEADGGVHQVDCVIYGTGFRTNDFMFPMVIRGQDGRELADDWARGAHAHLGMSVPGYPSMFIMYGPNTNTSGGSIIWYLEKQASYIRQALIAARARGADALQVRREVEEESDRRVQSRFEGTAWTRCDSWYRDESGRIIANWPDSMRAYSAQVTEFDPAEFEFTVREREVVS